MIDLIVTLGPALLVGAASLVLLGAAGAAAWKDHKRAQLAHEQHLIAWCAFQVQKAREQAEVTARNKDAEWIARSMAMQAWPLARPNPLEARAQ